MKNLKFGVFFLGLIGTVAALVSGVSAQSDRRPSARERGPAPEAFAFVAGGGQLGVRVSDVDAKTPTGGVHIDEVTAGSPAEKAGIKKGDVVVLPAALRDGRLKTELDCTWLEVTIPTASDLADLPHPSAENLREPPASVKQIGRAHV